MSENSSETARWQGKSVEEIRDAYDEDALETYEKIERLIHVWTGRYRRKLFSDVDGRVADIACGPGANIRYMSESADIVAVDVSPDVLEWGGRDAAERGRSVEFELMDAQNLAFGDDSFDAVVSGLSTCTFPDPIEALNEMGRVCKSGGTIRLLEHGKSSFTPYAIFQEWRRDSRVDDLGCRLYDDPADIVRQSELEVKVERKWWLGTLTGIIARPPED